MNLVEYAITNEHQHTAKQNSKGKSYYWSQQEHVLYTFVGILEETTSKLNYSKINLSSESNCRLFLNHRFFLSLRVARYLLSI